MVPWSRGPVVPHSFRSLGFGGPWSRGPVVPWSRGPVVPELVVPELVVPELVVPELVESKNFLRASRGLNLIIESN